MRTFRNLIRLRLRAPGPSVLGLWSYLLLVAAGDAFAWDDEDDSFGKASSTRRSSVIDYGYGQQKNNSAYQRQNSVIDLGGFKKADSPDNSIHVQPVSRPKLETIQHSIDRQNRELEDFTARSQRLSEERSEKIREQQKAEDNDWEASRWRDVETVAGAFVADGPYYKGGNKAVITDKGLVYSTGRGSVVAPDGYYYRSGNLWVGPNGKLFGQSGSGNNRYIWGSDGETAISGGRGFFTTNGYSWPAYSDPNYRGVSTTMRRP